MDKKIATVALLSLMVLVGCKDGADRWEYSDDRDVMQARLYLDSTVRVELTHMVVNTVTVETLGDTKVQDPEDIGGYGSGFVAQVRSNSDGHYESMVVTASHVCHQEEDKERVEMSLFGPVKIVPKTQSVKLEVMNAHGNKFVAHLLWESQETDVCVLLVEGRPGHPAQLADSHAPAGARLVHTGAPQGLFGDEYGAVVDGRSMGMGSIGGPYRFMGMMLATKGGSSGGPVWYMGRVCGILTKGSRPDGNISHAVPPILVQAAIDEARAKWLEKSTL